MMKLYKVLTKTGRSPYADYPYPLPKGAKPARWLPAIKGKLEMCVNGYHLCRKQDLVCWLGVGARIFEVEVKQGGKVVKWGNKVGTLAPIRLLRELTLWNARTQRLFACDCAKHVLHIFARKYPDDKRPRAAIEVAHRFIIGKATRDELHYAYEAAYEAAYAAEAASADAAAAAAEAAADAAAVEAGAGAYAGAARERQWQTAKLFEYLNGDRT